MRSTIIMGAAGGCLLISACGGGSGGDGPSNPASASSDPSFTSTVDGAVIRQVGIVSFQSQQFDFDQDVYMQFFRLDSPLTPSVLAEMDARSAALLEEGCTVSRSGDGDGGPDSFARIGRTGVSAGEVLVLSTPAGTLAELRTDESGAFGLGSISAPVPAGTRIAIPGAEFPAFDVAVPVVPAAIDIAVTGDPDSFLSGSDVVSWTPSSDPDATVGIEFFGFEEGSDGNPFGGDQVSVRCTTADDGSYAFDDDVREMLDAGSFGREPFTLERYDSTLAVSGDALLIVESTIIGF